MLPDDAYNFYVERILRRLEPELVGTNLIAQHVGPLPPGTTQVTQEELLKLQGEAKLGKPGQPMPREVGNLSRGTVYIPQIAHGFHLHRKTLEAAQNTVDFPTAYSDASTRLVMEKLEDMIFNGVPELNIKGIFADAGANGGATLNVASGSEWNATATTSTMIYNQINSMAATLEESGIYHAKKMVVDIVAYRALTEVNDYGLSAVKMLEDASSNSFFPNGLADIYIAPLKAKDFSGILPAHSGVICDFNPDIGERYVEEQINLLMPMPNGNEDGNVAFNIETYQSQVLHYPAAYLAIGNVSK